MYVCMYVCMYVYMYIILIAFVAPKSLETKHMAYQYKRIDQSLSQ